MTLGAMTWTCLLLAAGAAQPDVWNMNQNRFQIPIRFDAQRRAEIRELDLYVSHDQGQTWNMEGKATPEKEFFPYTAKDDGPYWFTVAIIDQKGRQEPVNIMTAPVGQRIMVDTVKPEIELNADRQGEEIRVSWRITELHPNPATLKLEYGETAEGPWTSLPITPGPTGEAKFVNPAAVVVRIQMQDMAENVGQAVKQVAAVVGNVAFAPPSPPTVIPPPSPTPVVAPPPPTPTSEAPNWNARQADAMPLPAAAHSAPPPPAPPGPLGDGLPPAPAPVSAPVIGSSQIAVAPRETGNQMVAFSSPQGTSGSNPGYPSQDAPAPSHSGLPPLQIVNRRQIKLEFDVDKFGPSGLGGVDVYVTTDDGAAWQALPLDAGATVLPPVDARAGTVRGSVTVPLNKEGVTYGYWVVVKSRAGLGKAGPRANDLPQLRVELDATPPEAKLLGPQADPSRRDTLVMMWVAKDKNLTSKPITLEWCDRPGPDVEWKPIGPAELPNTGRFDWQPPADIPPNVYLRLTVRDTAGNKAVATTPQPVLIDLVVPEVSNLGLGGVSLGAGSSR